MSTCARSPRSRFAATRPERPARRFLALPLLLIATVAPGSPSGAAAPGTDDSALVTYRFDIPSSEILIRTDRSGVLGFAGHRHVIRAQLFEGTVIWPEGASAPSDLRASVNVASLAVEDEDLDREDVAKVQADMEGKVLEADAFPEIAFAATRIEPDGDELRVVGRLRLHGVERDVVVRLAADREEDRVRLAGELSVKQTDYGIRPVKAGLGSVKVKNEVLVELRITALRSPPLDAAEPGSAG